ncbi:MAG TPA: R3H domain-containing nucleic acid-binding protein [bacterium]|jgi:spoIIIJ-associated protein|nr:R3H domain-containing nucleic acid-binding protein [bacterium]HOA18582.1 R3H domain-containing nucleic acid-binding protein [bacterium]
MKKNKVQDNEIKNTDYLNTVLEDIFNYIGVKPQYTLEIEETGNYKVDIQGNNLNFLIGYKGESLNALQSILSLIALKKTGQLSIITIDINNYKGKKIEKILEIAKSSIDKVRFFEKEIALPPMNPWERRQIHVLVSDYPDIESESVGEGLARRVILKPKGK